MVQRDALRGVEGVPCLATIDTCRKFAQKCTIVHWYVRRQNNLQKSSWVYKVDAADKQNTRDRNRMG